MLLFFSRRKNKIINFLGMGLFVFWILVPSIILYIAPSSDAFLIFTPLFFEWLVVKYYFSFKKHNDALIIFFLGLSIQVLFFFLMLSLTELESVQIFWSSFLFFGIIMIGVPVLILPQILLGIIIEIWVFFKKRSEKVKGFQKIITKHKSRKFFFILLIVVILGIIGIIIYQKSFNNPYQTSEVSFREIQKSKTLLGAYHRPLWIFRRQDFKNGDHFFGLSSEKETFPLPFVDALHADRFRSIYFDIFENRIFYINNEKAYIFDITKKQSTLLPESIQNVLSSEERKIIEAHHSEIMLATGGRLTGNVAIYDIKTGELKNQAVHAGYDGNRLYLFWKNGKGYRLLLNSHEPYKEYQEKTVMITAFSILKSVVGITSRYLINKNNLGPLDNNIQVYLEEHSESYHPTSEEEFRDRWGKLVFSGATSIYFKDKIPLTTLELSRIDSDKDGQWDVNLLYSLDEKHIGLVVEHTLMVINIENKKTYFISAPGEIETFLENAHLIASDNQPSIINTCYKEELRDFFQESATDKFVFCLQ